MTGKEKIKKEKMTKKKKEESDQLMEEALKQLGLADK